MNYILVMMIIYDFSHYYISIIMRSKKAGEAIAAGSYGCVFKPPIKCADGRKGYEKGISKLLKNKDAEEEMEVINNVMPILTEIPNNERYFIPNSEMPFYDCKIGEFSEEDLDNTKECTNLKYINEIRKRKKELTVQEIQLIKNYILNNKKDFTIIQQADGGIELTKFIGTIPIKNLTDDYLQKLNKNICDLIKNGVVKMNNKGLLHLDLKPENMVIEPELPLIRIIDWGFAKRVNNYKNVNDLERNLLAWTIMFNVPPSSILFESGAINYINNNYNGKNIDDILNKIFKHHEKDNHRELLFNLINKLGKDPHNTWRSFLGSVITKYTKYSKFDAFNYFKEVYRHNVDIYSVLVIYVYFINYNKIPYKYLSKLKDICYRYMYSPEIAVTKIDVNKLTEELLNLFGKEELGKQTLKIQSDKISVEEFSKIFLNQDQKEKINENPDIYKLPKETIIEVLPYDNQNERNTLSNLFTIPEGLYKVISYDTTRVIQAPIFSGGKPQIIQGTPRFNLKNMEDKNYTLTIGDNQYLKIIKLNGVQIDVGRPGALKVEQRFNPYRKTEKRKSYGIPVSSKIISNYTDSILTPIKQIYKYKDENEDERTITLKRENYYKDEDEDERTITLKRENYFGGKKKKRKTRKHRRKTRKHKRKTS